MGSNEKLEGKPGFETKLYLHYPGMVVTSFAQVLCKKVSSEHLWSLVTFLLDGLVDLQGHSSSGACVVLNSIVKLRGTSLSEQVGQQINWQIYNSVMHHF